LQRLFLSFGETSVVIQDQPNYCHSRAGGNPY
jgi:hypothetical protein